MIRRFDGTKELVQIGPIENNYYLINYNVILEENSNKKMN